MNIAEQIAIYRLNHGDEATAAMLERAYPPVRRLRDIAALHTQGSLHVMDRGNVCVGCGGQWPCRTVRILTGPERHPDLDDDGRCGYESCGDGPCKELT